MSLSRDWNSFYVPSMNSSIHEELLCIEHALLDLIDNVESIANGDESPSPSPSLVGRHMHVSQASSRISRSLHRLGAKTLQSRHIIPESIFTRINDIETLLGSTAIANESTIPAEPTDDDVTAMEQQTASIIVAPDRHIQRLPRRSSSSLVMAASSIEMGMAMGMALEHSIVLFESSLHHLDPLAPLSTTMDAVMEMAASPSVNRRSPSAPLMVLDDTEAARATALSRSMSSGAPAA